VAMRALRSATLTTLAAIAASGAVLDGVLVGRASDVQRALHTTPAGIAGLVVTLVAARIVAGAGAGRLGRRVGHWRVVAMGALGAAALTPALGAADTTGAAAAVVIVVGMATAPLATSHIALLVDAAPPGGRAQVVAVHAAARAAGFVAAAGIGALIGWKGALVVAVAGLLPAVVAARHAPGESTGRAVIVPRLTRLRSRSALTGALAIVGFGAIGLPHIAEAFSRQHHHRLSTLAAAVVAAAAVALVAAPLAGRFGDDRDRTSAAAVALVLFGLAVASAAITPGSPVLLAVAVAAVAVAAAALGALVTDVVPAVMRAEALGIAGLVAGFWGLTGAALASAGRSAWGPGAVLGLLGAAAVVAGGLLFAARPQVIEDVASVAIEAKETAARAERSGSRALSVAHVSFGYGSQPVLFDVSLEVPEGEIAALLGTNGAGKSTLLRLLAGLDHPHRGTIRVFGDDTTYLEAEQVLDAGVALLSGGRMTFPGLTVAENILVGTQKTGRGRAAEDDAFAAFPVLADRRDQRAGTLSGGEQQMLALARVLVQKPRLLLLDELTLGLAPLVIEELLATVRRLNDDGTTVLLVEQSANLALSLATHAFFMERGAVRFDGPAAELTGRDDLLRPVFLQGRGG
ncbi:MAG: ABC transporter ATP-binding protein, partial [Acidimicrobiales bacterium]